MSQMHLGYILENLQNPNVQNLVNNSPGLQQSLLEQHERALASRKVEHPEGDANAGTIVPVDSGVLGDFDDGSNGILDLALSYSEPHVAAGTAVFGLSLIALPLIAGIHSVDNQQIEQVGVTKAVGFTYAACKRTREDEDFDKPLTEPELEERLGPLDPASLAFEILCTEAEASEKDRCTDDEIARVQHSVKQSRAAVRRLRRRSALAFLGLPPNASYDDVNQKYKRMALELHPDKGGDAERFQQLQDMKERLSKSIQEEEDEEAKNKAQEEEDNKNLPPSAQAKQLRREAHKEAVKLWDTAREAEAEMFTDKGMIKGNAGPVLQRLRTYVESYSNSKVRMLPHGNAEAAKDALWKFKVDGLELIAIAALVDPSATSNMITTHINYKIVARSGSKEVAREAQQLINAICKVRDRVESFLAEMGRARAAAMDAEDEEKKQEESAGGPFTVGEEVVLVGSELEDDEGKHGIILGNHSGGYSVRLGTGRRITVAKNQVKRAPPNNNLEKNKGSTFDNDSELKKEAPQPQQIVQQGPTLLSKEPELPPDPIRDDWDPDFTHPYVGAMDGAGKGIFCRACRRWIGTRAYAHEAFLRHAKAAHKQPPQDWKGPIPADD